MQRVLSSHETFAQWNNTRVDLDLVKKKVGFDGSPRIYILQRQQRLDGGKAPRRILNIDRLCQSLLVRFSLGHDSTSPFSYLTEGRSCEHPALNIVYFENATAWYQLYTMQRADIFIAAHGNGLTNLVFMKQRSVVVELFPYRFSLGVYEALAHDVGLAYASWRSSANDPATECSNSHDLLHRDSGTEREECVRSEKCFQCARDSNIVLSNQGANEIARTAFQMWVSQSARGNDKAGP